MLSAILGGMPEDSFRDFGLVSEIRGSAMSNFIELIPRTKHGIFAIPYRNGCPLRSVRLPEGTIAEALTTQNLGDLPSDVPTCFEVGHGGVPATRHHATLGLVIAHVPISCFVQLLDGDLAAVYGAEAVPIVARRLSVG